MDTIEKGYLHPTIGYWQSGLPDEGLPDGTVEVPLIPGPDTLWTWNGSEWVEVLPDPAEALAAERAGMVCSPAQIRLTLMALGLLGTVQAIADADPMAAIVWEYAAEIRRTNALIDALAGDGFTPTQIDDIFRYAMQLVI